MGAIENQSWRERVRHLFFPGREMGNDLMMGQVLFSFKHRTMKFLFFFPALIPRLKVVVGIVRGRPKFLEKFFTRIGQPDFPFPFFIVIDQIATGKRYDPKFDKFVVQ